RVQAPAKDVLHAALGDVPAESEDAVLQAAPEPEVGEVEVGEERLLERAERTLEDSPQRFDRAPVQELGDAARRDGLDPALAGRDLACGDLQAVDLAAQDAAHDAEPEGLAEVFHVDALDAARPQAEFRV